MPNASFDNLLTTTASWSVSGRGSDGRDYTATVSVAPGARATYPLSSSGRSCSASIPDMPARWRFCSPSPWTPNPTTRRLAWT